MSACAHCGETVKGWSKVGDLILCHPSDNNPDCYRRVTVYQEPIGILTHQRPLPSGIEDIRRWWPVMQP